MVVYKNKYILMFPLYKTPKSPSLGYLGGFEYFITADKNVGNTYMIKIYHFFQEICNYSLHVIDWFKAFDNNALFSLTK